MYAGISPTIYASSTTPPTNVGHYSVTPSGASLSFSVGSSSNYTISSYVAGTLIINAATLTVTPDPQTRTYGQDPPTYTFKVTGFVNSENAGDAAGYAAPNCGSSYSHTTSVTASPTITCTGGSATNYVFDDTATSNVTVNAATLTVTPDPQTRTYGDPVPTYTFKVTGFVNSENAGDAAGYAAPNCGSSYSHTTSVTASPTITCTGGSATNYVFDDTATSNVTVNAATLTVTPDPQTRTYGQDPPTYTFKVTGFVNSENAGDAAGYAAPNCGSSYSHTTSVTASPTITCTGGSATNYVFDDTATSNVTVNAATLTVTPDPQTRHLRRPGPTYTFEVTGFVNSENAGDAAGYAAPSCSKRATRTRPR